MEITDKQAFRALQNDNKAEQLEMAKQLLESEGYSVVK